MRIKLHKSLTIWGDGKHPDATNYCDRKKQSLWEQQAWVFVKPYNRPKRPQTKAHLDAPLAGGVNSTVSPFLSGLCFWSKFTGILGDGWLGQDAGSPGGGSPLSQSQPFWGRVGGANCLSMGSPLL